jgi:uncharacterized protein YhjY with autotransporter beta-barrel domain
LWKIGGLIEQNDNLRHLLKKLQNAQFGKKSERLDHDQLQLAMEDLETAAAKQDAEAEKKQAAETPAKHVRAKLVNGWPMKKLDELLPYAASRIMPGHLADTAVCKHVNECVSA